MTIQQPQNSNLSSEELIRKLLNPTRFDEMFVEDCVQTALRIIWKAMQEGKGPNHPGSFLSWATKVATNRCIDRLRYEKRRPAEAISDEVAESVGKIDLNLDHQILLDEKKIELLTSLRRRSTLSEDSKIVVIEGFLFEKTDEEIAEMLSHSTGKERVVRPSNVRVIRHRNLDKLRHDTDFIDLSYDHRCAHRYAGTEITSREVDCGFVSFYAHFETYFPQDSTL